MPRKRDAEFDKLARQFDAAKRDIDVVIRRAMHGWAAKHRVERFMAEITVRVEPGDTGRRRVFVSTMPARHRKTYRP